MSLYVLDTDLLTLYFHAHPVVTMNVLAHASDELTISIVTVDEQVTGWSLLIRKARRPAELARAYT
jgi:tRNA(fMet)-specific endonuclease VapC